MSPGNSRHFVLLQGPCGLAFRQLQKEILRRGHACTRVALNGGDLFDGGWLNVTLYRGDLGGWPSWLQALHERAPITDLVCYGDCRPYHRRAIKALKRLGVTVHVLEEGYLRPHWITCERDGVNGYSRLVEADLEVVDERIVEMGGNRREDGFDSPQWRYMLQGLLYYAWSVFLTPLFPRYVTHRDLSTVGEAVLWLQRFASFPVRRRRTRRALARMRELGWPIHLVLLQLDGDSQVRVHSPFASVREFMEYCIAEFAAAGVSETLLVFKNHPLDNGVTDRRAVIAAAARRHGVEGRVLFLDTGKLVPLLERAISATSINSTACHQPLRRGIPTLVLGRAVYDHASVVPRMRLADFFRLRPLADATAYRKLVALLRQTSQIFGGFYSQSGRALMLTALASRLIDGGPQIEDFLISAEAPPQPARIAQL